MRQRRVVGIVMVACVAVTTAWAVGAGTSPGGAGPAPSWVGGPASVGDPDVRTAQAGPMGGLRHRPGMGRGRGFGMGAGPRGLGARALARLDLTQQQRKRIAELREATHRKAIRVRADLETAHLDLRKLVGADKPDRRAIDAQIDRISALRAGLEKDRVATLLDVRSVLTPEQLERLEELRGGAWGEGRGPWRGRGPGIPDRDEDAEDGDEDSL